MRVLRYARWLVLGAILSLIPASSYAGVFISVGFAPPVLPVYDQPLCPEDGYIWTPGYWAYGDDGYYWVPGAWVPAPYEGALWTPPYWGWNENVYVFHPGYWGRHVGYYGGINYGFGYFGVGFAGGEWREHHFAYNTAVVHVNRTVIHNTYVNNTVIHDRTIVNNNHVAYTGGPGGIRHNPTPVERTAMHESHVAATPVQQQHFNAAREDRANYFKANNGHPHTVAVARPMPAPRQAAPAGGAVNSGGRGHINGQPGNAHGNANQGAPVQNQPRPAPAPVGRPENRPAYQQPQHPVSGARPEPQPRSQPQLHPAPENRPAPQPHSAPQPQYHSAPQPQSRPAPPQYHPAPQPQSHPAPQARPEPRQYHAAPQSRPAPQSHPAPQPRQESHPAPREPHR
jgi:hypothetical protein